MCVQRKSTAKAIGSICPGVYELIKLVGPVKCALGDLDDEWGVGEGQALEICGVLNTNVRKYRS
jgi:hypothetical protein